MTGQVSDDAVFGESSQEERPNYGGAIYGSLLAASVVVGAGPSARTSDEFWPIRLAVLLLATGLVFWLAHAYSELVGDRIHQVSLDWGEVRRVGRHEWPLFQTAVLPSVAAVLTGALGGSNIAAGWAALAVAIASQVGWATFTVRRAGASGLLVVVTALVNLVLGSLIVLLKAGLHH